MSTANANLDLSTVDSGDLDQLVQKINQFYSASTSIKTTLAYSWERNQMMLDGKQWLQWSGDNAGGGQWKPLLISQKNEYIPRPVTNYMYSVYQTLKSYLIKNKPRSTITPNTQDYKDKVSAKIGDLILQTNWERLKEAYNYEIAAGTLLTYGTVFKKSYWDTTTINLVKVPQMQVQPIIDPVTGMISGQQEIPAIDPETGQATMQELPLGDVSTSVIDPYRIDLDPLAMHLAEAKWIMESNIQTLDWIRETYGKEGQGYTGLADQVKADTDLNPSMRRWYSLKLSSGTRNGTMSTPSSSSTMPENSAIVKEYWERPCSKYPKGRLIVVAGEYVLYADQSPCEGPEQGDWHPYSECRWEIFPGRFWGKSPLEDAGEIQRRINTIDSATILNRKTMAMPKWLIPMGSGIAIGEITGRPGQNVGFRSDGSGAEPKPVPGSGPDSSVFQERAQNVQDIKEITGAIDILQGDRPPGVNAASALSLLYEVGTGKLYPILDRWKMFIESDQKKQLRLIAKNYKEPRPDFIKSLRAKNSDLLESDINQFIGADMNDNCNVVVEAGSNIPKLQAAKQAMLVQAVSLGLLNLQNAANRVQLQQDLGISGYDADVQPDRKRAQWENDLMRNISRAPQNRPVVLAIDNHDLHLEEHDNDMKSPIFMSQPPEVQQAYMQHRQEHEQFRAMNMQAMMLQAQATGMPAIPPGQVGDTGAGNPQTGSGLPSNVKKSVMGADLTGPPSIETMS